MQPPPATPDIRAVTVALNPENNLSTMVSFQARNVDSARVAYTPPGGTTEFTPYYAVHEGRNSIATLGLDSLTTYSHVIEAIGAGGELRTGPVEFSSGDWPEFFKSNVVFATTGTATRGYVLVNFNVPLNAYTAAFDGAGRLRWYRAFEELGGFVAQHPNGNYSIFLGTTTGFQPRYGYFVAFTPAGQIVGRYQAPPPFYTDNHELLLQDGQAHLISYSIRRIDLTPYGGLGDVPVANHQILRFGLDRTVEFMWDGWDHMDPADWIAGRLPPACSPVNINCDIGHPNSLWVDRDGDYIYSVRNFSQVWKIHSRSGAVRWKLGAGSDDFRFVNDPLGGFSAQHYARTLDNGNLLLYDNGTAHVPPESRAVEYQLDPLAQTATLVWEYRHDPPLYTGFLGYAERLSNGHTVVGFGAVAGARRRSIVTEVDAAANVVWEGELTVSGVGPGVYRFVKIASLYEYARP